MPTRWAGRALVVAAVTSAALVAAVPPASAAPQPVDLGLAIAETNVDIGLAAVEVASTNAANPNITCSIPVANGNAVTYAQDTPVATIKGTDAIEGEAECVSRTVMRFSVHLALSVQYRSLSGAWLESGCERSGDMTAIEGTAVVTAAGLCSYTPDHPASGRPHRVHAVLTNSLVTLPYRGYSEPWQG